MNTYAENKKSAVFSDRRKYAVIAVVCALAVCLVLKPEIAPEAVSVALSGCVKRLIPALFPFICISGILLRAGFGEMCGKILGRPFSAIFGLHQTGSSAYILGAVCGFPVGGRAALSVAKEGELSNNEALLLCALCNNAGVGFVVCGVGAGLLGSVRTGVMLYLANFFSAFAAVTLGRLALRTPRRRYVASNAPEDQKSTELSVLSVISESVADAALSMLKICSFVVFFTVLADMLSELLGFIPETQLVNAALASFLEISTGIGAVSVLLSTEGAMLARFLLGFSLGFGGMSATMQLLSFSGKSIAGEKYILLKLVQGVICGGITTCFL